MKRGINDNFFDYLRYFAAFCVMYLHFTGYMRMMVPDAAAPLNVLRFIVEFFQPTVVLIAMSGFLTAMSFEKSESVFVFLKKRISRIYLDMWLSMAVYVAVLFFVVGNLFDKSMLKWFILQAVGFANTPDCLKEFATGSINGTLWFFSVIAQLYVVIAIIKVVTKNTKSKLFYGLMVIIFGILNIVSGAVAPSLSETMQKLLERTFIPYAFWFFIGVFCYNYKIYQDKNLKLALIILFLAQCILHIIPASGLGYYTDFYRGILTCIITPAAGYILPAKRAKLNLTYGLYLYHWLILNLIIHFKLYEKIGLAMTFIIFTIATIILAYIFRTDSRLLGTIKTTFRKKAHKNEFQKSGN